MTDVCSMNVCCNSVEIRNANNVTARNNYVTREDVSNEIGVNELSTPECAYIGSTAVFLLCLMLFAKFLHILLELGLAPCWRQS